MGVSPLLPVLRSGVKSYQFQYYLHDSAVKQLIERYYGSGVWRNVAWNGVGVDSAFNFFTHVLEVLVEVAVVVVHGHVMEAQVKTELIGWCRYELRASRLWLLPGAWLRLGQQVCMSA